MSLFIGGLAFSDRELQASIRLGVLIGSIASATLAYGLLRSCPKRSMDEENPVEIVKEGNLNNGFKHPHRRCSWERYWP